MPSLAEALRTAPRGALFLDPQEAAGGAIAAALREAGLRPRDVFISAWDDDGLADLERHTPGARLVWAGMIPAPLDPRWFTQLAARGVVAIEQGVPGLHAGWIEAAGRAGLEAWTYVVDDDEALELALRLGVDAIETDDPRWLRQRLDATTRR